MLAMRTLFVAVSTVFLALDLRAQARTDFDALPEGTSATALVTPAGTFQDLLLDGQGTPGTFFVDNASATLAGYPRFSPPMLLVPGGFVAGPTLASTPVKSFRILLSQPASAIRAALFLDTLPQGNRVDVEFLQAGSVNAQVHVDPVSFPGWRVALVYMCNHAGGPFDELRFTGTGTVDGGRFRCAIDTLVIANAPCGPMANTCAAGVVGGCPCANQPGPGVPFGCLHSSGQGGYLLASGIASLTVDEVGVIFTTLQPFTTGILAQSSGITNGVVLGDGVLCLSVPRIRVLSQAVGAAGYELYPLPWELPLSVRAGLTTPGTRWYQFVYRDRATFCTPSSYNVTNGVAIAWAP